MKGAQEKAPDRDSGADAYNTEDKDSRIKRNCNSVILHLNYTDVIKMQSLEDSGKILINIMEYAQGEKPPYEFSNASGAGIIWSLIQKSIDADQKKYNEVCMARSRNKSSEWEFRKSEMEKAKQIFFWKGVSDKGYMRFLDFYPAHSAELSEKAKSWAHNKDEICRSNFFLEKWKLAYEIADPPIKPMMVDLNIAYYPSENNAYRILECSNSILQAIQSEYWGKDLIKSISNRYKVVGVDYKTKNQIVLCHASV